MTAAAEKPPKKAPDSKCNGLTTALSYCPLPAGWGTDHVGQGRCKLHGGMAKGQPIKHGRYADPNKAPAGLRAKAQLLLEQGDPTKQIELYLAHLMALYENFLELHGNDEQNLTPELREHATLMLTRIGQLTDRIEKIRARTALTRAEVNYFQARAADIIAKYLPDAALRAAFMNEMRQAAPGPNPQLPGPEREPGPERAIPGRTRAEPEPY